MVGERPQKTGRQPLDAEVYGLGQRTGTLERPASVLEISLVNGWARAGDSPVRVHQAITGGSRLTIFLGRLDAAGASSSTFGYLPPGLRPLYDTLLPALSLNGSTLTGRLLRVYTDGTLSFNSLDTSAVYYAEGSTWLAER